MSGRYSITSDPNRHQRQRCNYYDCCSKAFTRDDDDGFGGDGGNHNRNRNRNHSHGNTKCTVRNNRRSKSAATAAATSFLFILLLLGEGKSAFPHETFRVHPMAFICNDKHCHHTYSNEVQMIFKQSVQPLTLSFMKPIRNTRKGTRPQQQQQQQQQHIITNNYNHPDRSSENENHKYQGEINKNKNPYFPPWLTKLSNANSQEEDDEDHENNQSPSSASATSSTSAPSTPPNIPANQYNINQSKAKYNLYNLRQKLESHHLKHPQKFTQNDITSVINSIFVASQNNIILISSTSSFLSLLLELEETWKNHNNDDDNEEEEEENGGGIEGEMERERKYMFMSRDTLIASSFHYCDCVIAREMGLYDFIHSAMRSTNGRSNDGSNDDRYEYEYEYEYKYDDRTRNVSSLLLPSSYLPNEKEYSIGNNDKREEEEEKIAIEVMPSSTSDDRNDNSTSTSSSTSLLVNNQYRHHHIIEQNNRIANAIQNNELNTLDISSFGPKAKEIYQNVARLKQMEIMSHALYPKKSQPQQSWSTDTNSESSSTITIPSSISISRVSPSPEKAASLRGLLLSSSNGDWNALSIRLSASLYRLRGILQYQQEKYYHDYHEINDDDDDDDDDVYNKEIVREAREALHVYAPLAQRLGMTKLKIELENCAFRILYKRQYIVSKSLYTGEGITAVSQYLQSEIEHRLHSDQWLNNRIERLTVMSRVKEPYSLWKKVLKLKRRNAVKKMKIVRNHKEFVQNGSSGTTTRETEKADQTNLNSDIVAPNVSQKVRIDTSVPSISMVKDAIALRVIVKGRHYDEMDIEARQAQDELLCYYIQDELIKLWPDVDANRFKDYIVNPKPNGYQSLHHTSSVYRFGEQWPFEVQIRSEDMHTKSEFGVAAHWDYKLQASSSNIDKADVVMKRTDSSTPCLLLSSSEQKIDTVEGTPFQSISPVPLKERVKSLQPATMINSYINALDTARGHLLKKNVFVFYLPSSSSAKEGKVLGIPAGSTVFDACVEVNNRYQLEVPPDHEWGDYHSFVNGEKARMNDLLKSGDTLIIEGMNVYD